MHPSIKFNMNPFRVGDKVKFVDNCGGKYPYSSLGFPLGSEGIVTDIDWGPKHFIEVEPNPVVGPTHVYFELCDVHVALSLVAGIIIPTAGKPKYTPFKVGDSVEVIPGKETSEGHPLELGVTHTIESMVVINNEIYAYLTKNIGKSYHVDRLRLATHPSKSTITGHQHEKCFVVTNTVLGIHNPFDYCKTHKHEASNGACPMGRG